jgi:predicted RNA binding protein YcfA (HicA-like mRNA interferase family)
VKLPRDLTGQQLSKALATLGYTIDRQTGSHLRMTMQENGDHHITISNHSSIKIGILNAMLRDVVGHIEIDRDELINLLKICQLHEIVEARSHHYYLTNSKPD